MRCSRPIIGGTIGLDGLAAASNDAIARIALLDGNEQIERLTAERSRFSVVAAPERLQVARGYFVMGFDHILAGYDHLLFVIALVFLLRGFRSVALAVTGFTVAHSLTLAGATLGFVGLPQAPVEALIALSIIFLAVDVARPQARENSVTLLATNKPWV